jgi:uncharacterized membrane protein
MKKKPSIRTKIAMIVVFPIFIALILTMFAGAATIYATGFILKITGILDAFEQLFSNLSKKLKHNEFHSPFNAKFGK